MAIKKFICGFCSVDFERNTGHHHKYCSKKCYTDARFGPPDDTLRFAQLTCAVCLSPYTVQTNPPSSVPPRKTCSRTCHAKLRHVNNPKQTADGRPTKLIDGKKHVEVKCELCEVIVWRPHKSTPHRFCSYSCASTHKQNSKGNVATYADGDCMICSKPFSQRVMLSKPIVRTCSPTCAGKLTALGRGDELDSRETMVVNGEKLVKVVCERCEKQAWLPHKSVEHRFCSRSCASKTHSEEGSGLASNELKLAYWTRVHGKDEAERRLFVTEEDVPTYKAKALRPAA